MIGVGSSRTEWTISCPPLEGKSWFLFPSLPAQPHKPIVHFLPICLSVSFTSYRFFRVFFGSISCSFPLLSSFLLLISACLFITLIFSEHFRFHNMLLTVYGIFQDTFKLVMFPVWTHCLKYYIVYLKHTCSNIIILSLHFPSFVFFFISWVGPSPSCD